MKLKPGFSLQDVCGEKVLVAQGKENIDFTKLITLNETAAFLYQTAKRLGNFTIDDLVKAICQEYEVSATQAEHDIKELLRQWKQTGLLAD